MSDDIKKPHLVLTQKGVQTTSMAVAEYFEKRHEHVLRDIRNLLKKAGDWGISNFGCVKQTMTYVDSQGVSRTKETSRTGHYKITRDGFVMLAMGFTGEKALAWKIRYIEAFNAMENALATRHQTTALEQAKEQMRLELERENTAFHKETIAMCRTALAEATMHLREEALNTAHALSIPAIIGRMKIPEARGLAGFLSTRFMLLYFALERSFSDAALVWVIHDLHLWDCATFTAKELAELSGYAFSPRTVPTIRARLIKRGLLRNWTASDRWEIDRKVFEHLIQEALLVAHPRRAPKLEESWTLEPQLTEWLALVPPTPEGIQ